MKGAVFTRIRRFCFFGVERFWAIESRLYRGYGTFNGGGFTSGKKQNPKRQRHFAFGI